MPFRTWRCRRHDRHELRAFGRLRGALAEFGGEGARASCILPESSWRISLRFTPRLHIRLPTVAWGPRWRASGQSARSRPDQHPHLGRSVQPGSLLARRQSRVPAGVVLGFATEAGPPWEHDRLFILAAGAIRLIRSLPDCRRASRRRWLRPRENEEDQRAQWCKTHGHCLQIRRLRRSALRSKGLPASRNLHAVKNPTPGRTAVAPPARAKGVAIRSSLQERVSVAFRSSRSRSRGRCSSAGQALCVRHDSTRGAGKST